MKQFSGTYCCLPSWLGVLPSSPFNKQTSIKGWQKLLMQYLVGMTAQAIPKPPCPSWKDASLREELLQLMKHVP